ncbi:ABC transporter substrate-binding protein [Pseudomonas sp. GD04087]|uniref:ABC transporter substrate-binding protein n=1 Tax=unclassified Pseudomonas TaxID=196821 RepID=UPI00244BC3F3|nr:MULTISPECIES: ABC transporter substrate-binding protein [unclassified Pseudomonas]MDH0289884.1 ABC transporter substrate-binding protein [Pseudomonas sp. GD04087]MDH1050159.1 ABC transporter substrate-binding protein [Pseudomonas sp. GD03903]MDH2002039.1 ABC transporter substrate-binding protein [Pseudomonas sp. GD03691]
MPFLSSRSRLLRSLATLALLCLGWLGLAVPAEALSVTDVLGRKVEVSGNAQRVVLGEGRLFFALALLDRDNPFQRVVGWQNDVRLLDPHTFDVYAQRFPQVKQIPLIGQASEQSVSAEQILALKPDLAVFSIAGEGPTQHSPLADILAAAGVPVLFVDFRVHPIEGVRTSLTALGAALGRQAEADQYLKFYDAHLQRIRDGVAGLDDAHKPSVFLELLAGVWQAPGHTTGKSGLGSVIDTVGGRNIAAGVVPGALGDISVEYALSAKPDLYIATGNRQPGLILGAGVSQQQARESLGKVLQRPEFASLDAIRNGKAHGLWHDFYNSPFNILAIEAMARWVHPERFADLDPAQTQAQINLDFLRIGLDGTYWVDAGQPE